MNRLGVAIAYAALALVSATPSVKATIVQSHGAVDDQTVLTVKLVPTDLTLGAYQGTFRFDPGSLVIVSATSPSGDGTRIVNPADTAKGVVRFAGYTVSNFKSTVVLTLAVKSTRPMATANLRADLEVASDVNGVVVPKNQLIPARGFTTAADR